MKTIIAGSRILGWRHVGAAIFICPWANEVTDVICGCANGVDRCGLTWARLEQKPVAFYPAWPDQYQWALINRNQGEEINYPEGGYNRGLGNGFVRNAVMAGAAEALILVWDGISHGSAHMLKTATKAGLKVYDYRFTGEK